LYDRVQTFFYLYINSLTLTHTVAKFVDIAFKEASMEERDGAHHYSFDGHKSVGITTILNSTKPDEDAAKLEDWKVKENIRWETPANYIFKTAGPIGTDTHNAIEAYLKGEKYSPKYTISKGHMMNIVPLLDKIDNIRTNESRLFSKELGIAGTVDCVAEYDGVLSIIDFKTKRSDRKEEWIVDNFLQATAYGIMWEELTGEKISQIVILISTEKNSSQAFIKDPADYVDALKERIKEYYK